LIGLSNWHGIPRRLSAPEKVRPFYPDFPLKT
jgi:hypothetical protein